SIHAMLRCAILSEVAEFAPSGIGVSSNLISATRHWCGAFVMTSLNDDSVPENGPSTLAGTVWTRNFCCGWLMSSQQPKNESTSTPGLTSIVYAFGVSSG